MYHHGPSCLRGPVTRTRRWWSRPAARGAAGFQAPFTWGAADMGTSDRDARPRDLPIRSELVERVRREIAAGTYETPAKWEIALERLLARLEER